MLYLCNVNHNGNDIIAKIIMLQHKLYSMNVLQIIMEIMLKHIL